jgi:EF hand
MARSFPPRWLRRVYRLLLYTYPPDFRRRYGRDMERVFSDRCRSISQTDGLRGLLRFGAHAAADWFATTVREGIASMRVPAQAAATGPVFDGVPVFYTCGSSMPSRGSLINGAVLSLAVFSAVSFLIGLGGSHRIWHIGSHHPSRSHLLPAHTSAVPSAELESEIKVKSYPDEPPISPYFRLILVLGALDTDHDNVISAAEIAAAPKALRKLDKNHDGRLTAEECGARSGDARGRLEFMRFHPVLAALDTDHDGEISAKEMKRAPKALATLDKNGDGKLTLDELLPDPLDYRAP